MESSARFVTLGSTVLGFADAVLAAPSNTLEGPTSTEPLA